jgi:hypothetical protein
MLRKLQSERLNDARRRVYTELSGRTERVPDAANPGDILAMTFALLARANNPRVVGAPAGFPNVILFFPSGAVYPVESFPKWLRVLAEYNPETHAVGAPKSILFKPRNGPKWGPARRGTTMLGGF